MRLIQNAQIRTVSKMLIFYTLKHMAYILNTVSSAVIYVWRNFTFVCAENVFTCL